jgi:hypothetical protein
MLQTIPALLMLPFSGVVIDREDRRRLVMVLDAARGLVILVVAVLAYRGMAQLWEVYLMSILVAAGFWMFWPTITALIQELTPESHFVHANSFLLAGLQGGWLIAGSMVGFVYNSIGLGGILFLDFASYVVSFTCYLFVRKGRHVVMPAAAADGEAEDEVRHESDFRRFIHELRDGIAYIQHRPRLLLLGTAWALFIGAMLSQGIITAPYSDRLLKAGAIGYGWLNGGWAVGACLSAFYTPMLIRGAGHRLAISASMAVLGCCLISLPFIGAHVHGSFHAGALVVGIALAISVLVYSIMGWCRALGGVAISSTMMELVPKHFMGRVQNTFYFAGTCLQFGLSIAIGAVAHRIGLALAFGMVGTLYLLACLSNSWPVRESLPAADQAARDRNSTATETA